MDIHYSSKRGDWETPGWLFQKLDWQFSFTLDVAANKENAKVPQYFSEDISAFENDWFGRCFMNPPYGREIGHWMARANQQVLCKNASVVVALVPARVDTKWWHDWCKDWPVNFLKGRLTFEIDGNPVLDKNGRPMPAPFPSAIVYIGL